MKKARGMNMKEYKRFRVICKNRQLEEQIRVSIKSFLNLFESEDHKVIIKIMKALYNISEIIISIFIAILYFAINVALENKVLAICACSLVFVVINIMKIDKLEVKSLKAEMRIFQGNKENSYLKIYLCMIIDIVNTKILIGGILPYAGALIIYGLVYNFPFLYLTIGSIFSIIYYLLFLILYFVLNFSSFHMKALINRNNLCKRLFMMKEEYEVIKKSNKNSLRLLFEREFSIKSREIIIKIISIVISFLVMIAAIIFIIMKIDVNYYVIGTLSILPICINILLVYVIFNGLFEMDYIKTTYYLVKVYNMKSEFLKSLFLEVLYSIRFLIIPFIMLMIISYKDIVSVMTIAINIVYCILMIYIVCIRMNNFVKYSLDELNYNVIYKMSSNGIEDYLIVGLPFILVSGSLVKYMLNKSMIFIFGYYLLFIGLVTVYLIIKNRSYLKSNILKGENNVINSENNLIKGENNLIKGENNVKVEEC